MANENNQASLTVEDTGQGIDESFLPHVFELFRQGDASTSRAQTGMGIGLAVVRQLVDLHKGSISAYSAGRGRGRNLYTQTATQCSAKDANATGPRRSHVTAGVRLPGGR